jgi:hypothetical protein
MKLQVRSNVELLTIIMMIILWDIFHMSFLCGIMQCVGLWQMPAAHPKDSTICFCSILIIAAEVLDVLNRIIS